MESIPATCATPAMPVNLHAPPQAPHGKDGLRCFCVFVICNHRVIMKFLLPTTEKPHVRWGQLYGSAISLKLADAVRALESPLLVIAANARDLNRLEDELRFFLPAELPLLSIP